MMGSARTLYIGRVPHFSLNPSAQRVRRDACLGAGQRVWAAARIAAALMPSRLLDVRRRPVL